MIKTLRITSVLAAIAAAALIYYFVIPMVVGAGGDERVDKVLGEPTVVDQFRQTTGANSRVKKPDISPLVKQATAFAGYLTPPKTLGPPSRGGSGGTRPPIVRAVSPKFTVLATTYIEGIPELSQALIDEPGRDRRWVRQASMVGGLFIEQVRDGVVVVKSSKETYELAIVSTLKGAPVKRTSPNSSPTKGQSPVKRSSPTYNRAASGLARAPSKPTQSKTPVSGAKSAELVSRLRDLQRISAAGDKARIGELISRFEPTQVSAEDAQSLTKRGDKVRNGDTDPNRTSSLIKGGKIDTGSAKSAAPSSK